MKVNVGEYTRFMLDDSYWNSVSTLDEAYLVNGKKIGDITQVSDPTLEAEIIEVELDNGMTIEEFYGEWQRRQREGGGDMEIIVSITSDRYQELVRLLNKHNFTVKPK